MRQQQFDLHINDQSGIQKSQQIVDAICHAIRARKLRRGASLPSVNEMRAQHRLSRDTVVRAYDELKRRGIIVSEPGKGYYVAAESLRDNLRIFLLFDELSPYKQLLYGEFKRAIGRQALVDVAFHHYNLDVYRTLLFNAKGKYDVYAVMPYDRPELPAILSAVDAGRLFVFDRLEQVGLEYPCLYQDFERGIHEGLIAAADRVRKYEKLVLVFPKPSEHPLSLIPGFRKFCREFGVQQSVLCHLKESDIQRGNAYLVIDDDDLVMVAEHSGKMGWRFGRDIGLISYNDTPVKKVVGHGGVTVISTDFAAMGKRAAEMILAGETGREATPTRLILRDSL
jgi:DNA-binding transcriptional regulator YhcF (GntR family)